MQEYEPVMGMEIHVQLKTKAKMFCACSAEYEKDNPNTHCCPVCLGLPGALPTINKAAIDKTILVGLALHSEISCSTHFSRKNYFYPDLPKGYQISQFENPLCTRGYIDLQLGEGTKRIAIQEAHLEEDTGKSLHIDNETLLDFNKSGIPLLEIVSAPELKTKEEVLRYAQSIRQLLRYLDVSDCDMEKGQMRCELNISMRRKGETELPNYRVEIKNLNSFRALGAGVEYEIGRQGEILNSGGTMVQETRGWDEAHGQTKIQRLKEGAHDYRYFPEPDLPPLVIDDLWMKTVQDQMPELPEKKLTRFTLEYGLPKNDAAFLTGEHKLADIYEEVVLSLGNDNKDNAKNAASWILGVYLRLHNENSVEIGTSQLTGQLLALIIQEVMSGNITKANGEELAQEVFVTGKNPQIIIAEKGLQKVSGENELSPVVDEILTENPQAVADYKSGKTTAIGFLIGQVMKKTHGRADHGITKAVIEEKLK